VRELQRRLVPVALRSQVGHKVAPVAVVEHELAALHAHARVASAAGLGKLQVAGPHVGVLGDGEGLQGPVAGAACAAQRLRHSRVTRECGGVQVENNSIHVKSLNER
jgi:hypothetical protein